MSCHKLTLDHHTSRCRNFNFSLLELGIRVLTFHSAETSRIEPHVIELVGSIVMQEKRHIVVFIDRHHAYIFEPLELFVEDELCLLELFFLGNFGISCIKYKAMIIIVENKPCVVVNTSVCIRQHSRSKLEFRQNFDNIARGVAGDYQ